MSGALRLHVDRLGPCSRRARKSSDRADDRQLRQLAGRAASGGSNCNRDPSARRWLRPRRRSDRCRTPDRAARISVSRRRLGGGPREAPAPVRSARLSRRRRCLYPARRHAPRRRAIRSRDSGASDAGVDPMRFARLFRDRSPRAAAATSRYRSRSFWPATCNIRRPRSPPARPSSPPPPRCDRPRNPTWGPRSRNPRRPQKAIAVVSQFTGLATAAVSDASRIIGAVRELQGRYYGQFANGSLSTLQPATATVCRPWQPLRRFDPRSMPERTSSTALARFLSIAETDSFAAAAVALAQPLAAAINDPADAIRLLIPLASWVTGPAVQDASWTPRSSRRLRKTRSPTPSDVPLAPPWGLPTQAYLPASYQDAQALRQTVCGVLDTAATCAVPTQPGPRPPPIQAAPRPSDPPSRWTSRSGRR